MNEGLKKTLRSSRILRFGFKVVSKIFSRYSLQGINNHVLNEGGLLYRCLIRINGRGNTIVIRDFTRLMHCKILVSGDNNVIEIGENVYIEDSALLADHNNNSILIGKNTIISRGFEGSVMEGTRITIGEDCLFSGYIGVRTCDSHSILNMKGMRVNQSQNVTIGNHVWIGTNVLFLKGATVLNDSVVAARSVITKRFDTGNVVIAGQPAKIVKENIKWDKHLIPMYREGVYCDKN